MLSRLVQPEKAESPILVTESGIVTLVRLEHPLKASLLIEVIESGIFILLRLVQPEKENVTFSRLVQPEKSMCMFVPVGIVTSVRLEQSLKAS